MPTTLPLTYPDLVCNDDLDSFARETTSDLESLIQDVYHVLVQDLGSNPDDPDRGIGIYQYLNGTAADFLTLPTRVETQLNQDDRIDSTTCKIQRQGDGTFTVFITVSVGGKVIPLEYGWQNGNFTYRG